MYIYIFIVIIFFISHSFFITLMCGHVISGLCLLFSPPPSPVSPYKGPRNLQTSEPGKTSFRVTWDHAPGDVKGYKVTFHPSGDDIDLGELQVGPYDNTVVLEELRCVSFFPSSSSSSSFSSDLL
jgi:hypothetical protein